MHVTTRLSLLVALASCWIQMHAQLPVLAGTVPGGVTTINTSHLLTQMNQGTDDFTIVAAHRGYWLNAPENSTTALTAAFDAGVEAIEIDLRTTSDGVIVVSHDADLIKETNGSGLVNSTSWSTISGLKLRDRKGNPQSLTMLRFSDALSILANYSSNGTGPVIIADIKDQNPWPTYQAALKQVETDLSSSTQPGVVFKMKMNKIPSVAAVQSEFSAHPRMGHIIPVVNPEDGLDQPTGFDGPDWDPSVGAGNWSPTSSNFKALVALSQDSSQFIQQFELNINTAGDGASKYPYPGPLKSFATYYQPSFYPEGVSTIDGATVTTYCCYQAQLPTDLRGVLNFSLYYNLASTSNVSLITADNLAETLNFLVGVGKRNTDRIK
jgi:hypothetical protein